MNQTIAVLGAGSSGMATAAWLTLDGRQVTLWDVPAQAGDLEAIRKNGGIMLKGGSGRSGAVMPSRLTCDLEGALADAGLVIVCTSASRHSEIARLCAPLARSGQAFLLTPGNFGSILFHDAFERAGRSGILTGETCGCLWACRRTGPGEVLVASPLKSGVMAAAFPTRDTGALIRSFEGVLPLTPAANVLEASLNSPNVISHVAGTVLNAAAVERKGPSFAFFQDGLSESVVTCFHHLEQERNAAMAAAGLRVYNPDSEPFNRALMDYGEHRELDLFRSLDGPSSLTHRYVSEDAGCGVAMLISLGRRFGAPMPLTEAFLTIVQSINGQDYLANGRTLENLRLDEPARAQMLEGQ